MKIYRHGDLLIKECETRPELFKKKDNIVAYGEFTGHHHTVLCDDIVCYTDIIGKTYIDLTSKGATITHPEHKEIELAPKFYEVVIEQEFDPFAQKVRQVKD